jgi:isoquinoline 1-oxidoreductase subunit beta
MTCQAAFCASVPRIPVSHYRSRPDLVRRVCRDRAFLPAQAVWRRRDVFLCSCSPGYLGVALASLPRIVKLNSVKDLWNYGEPYDSYPIDTAFLRKVVDLVADKGGWRAVPKGHGLGIAAHRSFVGYIATVVEMAVDDKGKLTVPPGGNTAIDCGTYVNPERIQLQIEGAAIMGLSLAKHGAVTFKDGKVQQGNFEDYPLLRIDESPS